MSGIKVYIAWRRAFEIYRDKRPDISTAIREDVAGWAIDIETLYRARRCGCRAVGVWVRDTGDLWLTQIEHFFTSSKTIDYTGRGGSAQRVLPFKFFQPPKTGMKPIK